MIQSETFLGRLLGPLLKLGLPLIKNAITPLAKGVLILVSAVYTGIHKKILKSGNKTALIISNNEMEDIIKIG